MSKIVSIFVAVILLVASTSAARPVPAWPYDRLLERADLVVVATPSQVTPTGEEKTLFGSRVQSVETKFQVRAVFKGDEKTRDITLCHYVLFPSEGLNNGPNLVSFEPKAKKSYLMFLRQRADGKYESVVGQTDAAFGIKTITGANQRQPSR